jgi:predicted metal-dependent peptidase
MANKTTASDDLGIHASQEAGDAFDLQPHLVGMLLTEPFFADLIRTITKIRDEKIPTAGVCVKDSDLYLYWNPRFLAALNSSEVFGLLKHECYHLFFDHCTTRRMEPHNIHNIATDLAINSVIPEDELPKCGLMPGRPFDLSKITDPAAMLRAKMLSDKIAGFPKGQAADWYFSALMEDDEISKMLGDGEGDMEGIPGMDSHEGWGDMDDEEREIVKGKVREILRKAVKRADSSNGWGTIPAEMRANLRKMVDDSVDWKRVLQNFAGTSQRLNKSPTLRRINRKYPYIHPGVHRSHTATVGVFVDMSGSVGDSDLERIYAVLGSLAKRVTFKFYPFDTEVDTENAFEWKKGQKKPPIRFRSGGTSFIAVNEFVKKNRHELDGVIICTDGMAEDPGPSPVRRCWVLVPGTKLAFPTPAGDIVVTMDVENKKARAA